MPWPVAASRQARYTLDRATCSSPAPYTAAMRRLEHSAVLLDTAARAAGAALIDEGEIAARGVGLAGLMSGVDGEWAAWASVDVDDGVGECGLLGAFGDDDREVEVPCGGVAWSRSTATVPHRRRGWVFGVTFGSAEHGVSTKVGSDKS